MRSIPIKAGLAAIMLSLAAGVASAATLGEGADDNTSRPVIVAEPTANTVLGQLESTVDGVRLQAAANNLSGEQAAQLEREASSIRTDALHAASANGGVIPQPEYRQIMARINDLSVSAGVQPQSSTD